MATPAPRPEGSSSLTLPEVKESFAKLGYEALGGTPDVLAQREDAEIKKWADLVREKNIHVEP